MNTSASENSMAISSLDSSTMAQHVPIDSDADGIFAEGNHLTRNDLNEDVQPHLPPPQQTVGRRSILRILIFSFLLACILYVVVDFCGDRTIEKHWNDFLEQTQDQPYKAIIAVVSCYIIATIFFVPGSILTFGAGFVIGHAFDNMYVGILLSIISVFIGASIGSICSFLLGRYLFRDCVLRLAISYPIFQAIERALETNGLKIMVLLRLSPLIPFNALDYISGITSISLRDYTIALIAILPGAIVLCIAGASAESLSDRTASAGNKVVETIVIVVGLVLGCYGVYLASHHSKVELDRILAAQSEQNSTDDSPLVDHDEEEGGESTELV